MKKIMLIAMFVLSLFIMSNCDEEVQVEGQGKPLENDNSLEQSENRNMTEFRQTDHGEPGAGEEMRR